ncbi:MAG: T9SS type A sorting domain-containing protein [bacterium]
MNRIIICFIAVVLLFMSTKLSALDNLPALPNTTDVVTCFPDTTGYKVVTVGPVGRDYTDLQKAINEASLGTIIRLDAGASFYGGFVLPKKTSGTGWIIIMSSRMDALPDDENRINPMAGTGISKFPTQASAMAKIITTNTSGIPCFVTQANAHHYRLVGLEITADLKVTNSYGLVNLGDASSAQNSLSLVPEYFVIDRCYIHGHTDATIMKYGVGLNCANAAVIDSYISDFHSIGYDAQAIAGINGPGPFKIINNYLEASGENIMFGGGAAAIAGLVPSDIEVRQNHFFKPRSWRVDSPTYTGKHWTIKNLFELKTGMRVLLDGNVLENSWADLPIGQSGCAILLTIRTEGGGSPQAEVSDITISNNIIRHAGSGISISGRDDGSVGNRSKRIRIFNNLFDDISGPAYGDGNIDGPNDGTFFKIGEPEDVTVDHNTIFQTGAITWAGKVMNGFVFTNNITNSKISAAGYQGIYGPGYQQGNNTIAHYFTDVTDANQHINKNVFIGGDASKYTNYNTVSKNYFPATVDAINFVKFRDDVDYHLNFALLTNSPYYKNASDGKDIGIDVALIDSAMRATRGCPIKYEIKVTSVVLDQQLFQIYINDSEKLNVTVLPWTATNKNFSFRSTNDEVASVLPSGVVTGLKPGSANIIVKTEDGGFEDTCWVKVYDPIGVEDEEADSIITISPNPATNFIEISKPCLDCNIEIYNVLGEKVISASARHAVQLRINIADLPKGMYFVKAGERITKFVKT